MKKTVKFVFKILAMLVVVLLVLLVSINIPWSNFRHQSTDQDYSSWMSEHLDMEDLIINVSMLGAHDAFTAEMDFFSPADSLSADSIQQGVIGLLIKGFSYRQSRTQVASATELLEAGVRYFDVRLSYNEEEADWYTTHTYFSQNFSLILDEIALFLENHPGEFVILDLQHVYGVDYESEADFLEIYSLFFDAGMLDYAYPSDEKSLFEISVGDVTDSGASAGAIIISKFTQSTTDFFDYGSSIRSNWPNMDSFSDIFEFLEAEAGWIDSGEALTGNQLSGNLIAQDSLTAFRVMQAVATMQMNGGGIVEAIRTWSLLERAKDFNQKLIAEENFELWLDAMPIVMVDYANTNQGDFLDQIMDIIIENNQE